MNSLQKDDPFAFKPDIGFLPKKCAELIEPDENIIWIGAPNRKLLNRWLTTPLIVYFLMIMALLASGEISREQLANPATVINIMFLLIAWIFLFEGTAHILGSELYALTDRAIFLCLPGPFWAELTTGRLVVRD